MRINIRCGFISVRTDRSSALSLFVEKQESRTTGKERNLREYNLNRIKRK